MTCRIWVVVCLGLVACAGPSPRHAAAPARARLDADTLAVAALRAWHAEGNLGQAQAFITRAAAAQPQRPELLWLQARLCHHTPGCAAEAIESQLRQLDPANAVAWLGVLERAQARGDFRGAEHILEAMSRAARFDLYWTTLVWRLASALQPQTAAGSATPLTDALDYTVQWLSQTAVPAFAPVTEACAPAKARTAAAIATCLRLAEAMQRSDTTLVESLGLGIAQQLTAPGSDSAAKLEERVATLGYRSRAAGSIMELQTEREKLSAQLLGLMKKLPREQDVTLAILRWAGQPLTPQ